MPPSAALPLHEAATAHHQESTSKQPNLNPAVPNLPYFIPQHKISPGTALPSKDGTSIPTLFKPLKIRSITLKNRIIVAPMCQYSTASSGPNIGKLTPYHVATLGHYALKGAALTFIEATAVQPNGRISPNDSGLWHDAQIEGVRNVVDFIHAQGGLAAIQLAHAGRKASQVAPWIGAGSDGRRRNGMRATKDVGGWPENVVAPSGGEESIWDGKKESDPQGGFWKPRELSIREVREVVEDFTTAARRAVEAGVDVIEIHGAHGYLIHQFLSPVTNLRSDEYGGSFEGRTRLVREIATSIRSVIPTGMPLFLRLSVTDWLENSATEQAAGGSWNVESTIRLAKLLPDLGVDLLDASSGGNHLLQNATVFPIKDYQTKIAGRIRRQLKAEGTHLLIGAVGLITDANQARNLVEEPEPSLLKEARAAHEATDDRNGKDADADAILVARQFMREPEWVLRVASALGVDVAWPSQFLRVRFPKL